MTRLLLLLGILLIGCGGEEVRSITTPTPTSVPTATPTTTREADVSENITPIEKNTAELLGPFFESVGVDKYDCEHKPGRAGSGIKVLRFCEAYKGDDIIAVSTVQFVSGQVNTVTLYYDASGSRIIECLKVGSSSEQCETYEQATEMEAVGTFIYARQEYESH